MAIIEKVRSLPIWKNLQSVEALHGGVSNASFKVVDANGQYVVRVGDDYPFHQVERQRELIASVAAHRIGLSPEVVHAERGVMVLRFIEGRTYVEADVRQNLERCVELVKQCHSGMKREITGQGAIFWVFQILRDYGATLIAAKHRNAGDVADWMKLVDQLEEAQVPQNIVFGHHDLLPTNFIDDGKKLWLIDWEYAAFGTPMFDLANLASNNSFDDAFDLQMLEIYFDSVDGGLLRSFAAMKAASALREAMWAMVSELHLNAPGVNYVDYAATYLRRFHALYSSYVERFS